MTFGGIVAIFISVAIVIAIDQFLRNHSELYKQRMEEMSGTDEKSEEEKENLE